MSDDQARPAASLTAERIKRGVAPTIDAAEQPVVVAAPPAAEAALRRQVREVVAGNADNGGRGGAESGFLNWRRAGLFGLVYLGALAIFAAAFDVLP